ncbi:MAG TPA: DUF488 domain-containing protein [Candidatus Sulfotelmatobacter sp.]|nr:DUF488 domain-containing protein [Candidatus Sulfotelmatobacter sp.]
MINSQITIHTIGHSTRTLPEFIAILRAYHATLVVDVRRIPRSRHNSQFNKETLPDSLKSEGINYIHMPEIGGLRRPKPDSINAAWRNKSFRGYADYMQTKEFTEDLLNLIALARESCVTVMCAEALPWRCHRSLLADTLVVRNVKVQHIISKDSCMDHKLSEWAHVEGTKITYPLFSKETPQRSLSDFNAST